VHDVYQDRLVVGQLERLEPRSRAREKEGWPQEISGRPFVLDAYPGTRRGERMEKLDVA
jgi:hypothetical protein